MATHARLLRRLAVLAVLLFITLPSTGLALTQVSGFGSNPGNLLMYKYVPAGLPSGAPLVVALHGCTQQASAYDAETGWEMLADRWKFALLLPEQQSGNNSSRCFNWFEPGDISRGQGEALSIKQMIDRMKTDHGSAAERVYVTGLSAGAAMTAVMLATYPEVFAGGAILAGVPYRCGTGLTAAFSCMSPGSDESPASWGNKVRAASSHGGPWPIVSIWHGDADYTVRPANQTELMEQWTNVHGIDQVADVQESVAGYPHRIYQDGSGVARVETWTIPGMGHGTPVDPGTGDRQCGTAGAYILDVNICSSWYIGRFFGLDNSDAIAPTVSLSQPLAGASVSGNVTLAADASDNVGVTLVEFLVDDLLVGSDSQAPWQASWNASAASNGAHRIRARAVDAAGNVGSSAEISVSVSGGVSDTTPPSVDLVYPANGATVGGTLTLAAVASDNTAVASVEFLVDGVSLGQGSMAAQSGPWTLDWNTTALAPGAHALSVRALDPSGNLGTDDDTTVIVSQNLPQLSERYSDADGNGDHYDQAGWSGDFVADPDNATAGAGPSLSAYGYASSGSGCQVGWKTRYLQRSVTLGSNPQLRYSRKLDLKANINTSTVARFRVLIGSTIVDEQSVTYGSYVDSTWQARGPIDLSSWAGQSVTLRFESAAYANVCLEAWAKARIDDIEIANASAPSDQTPPSVALTSPTAGVTLTGVVSLQATASDDTGVVKVEFYVDGSLLGVDQQAPYTWSWDTSAVAAGAHELSAKAYDAAGNVGSAAVVPVTIDGGGGGGGGSLSLSSQAADDGYVKATASGGSPAVGTLEAYYGLALGRGSDSKYNRALLSFDTSAIPAGATITAARLRLTHRGGSGDPWSGGNSLVVDVRSGCFGACTTETGDYAATATASAVATVPAFSSGEQPSSDFNATGLTAINPNGQTQLRLRFAQTQGSTAYLWVGSGMQAVLEVEYVVP
ncbi:MAG: PHB depolymerase family esterase [Xanthomonadales bacterium]|nr:PHB depolymerase family esterase [Xanthomonadales bacterium]